MIRDKETDELALLIGKSLLHTIDPEFDDKVMQRVVLASVKKTVIKQNLRLSWIFLIFSAVIFPLGYMLVSRNIQLDFITKAGFDTDSIIKILYPAGIIIFAVILLLQIDNLLRLSYKQKLV